MSEKIMIADRLIDDERPPLLVFLGSTGSGKTSAALEVPDAEILCADRFTAWAEMDIGTAKPTTEEQALRPHHLINMFDLGELAVGHSRRPGFVPLAGRSEVPALQDVAASTLEAIGARNHIPVVVGGSVSTLQGLTLGTIREENPELKALLDDMSEAAVRAHCEDWGLTHYFEDNNPLDGIKRRLYNWHTAVDINPLPNVFPIGIRHATNMLAHRIRQRVDRMWDEGLPEEVSRLVDAYGWVRPLREAIGYKEFAHGPDGRQPAPDQIRNDIIDNTIGYIWAQSDTFNRMQPVYWTRSPEEASDIGRRVVAAYREHGFQAARRFQYPYPALPPSG